jgi:cytochrome c biogenesis protein CcmG, thiol:disulfide interchange protein DsbE
VSQGYLIGRRFPSDVQLAFNAMSRRGWFWVLGVVVLIAVLVVGISQSGGGTRAPKPDQFDVTAASHALAAAPGPLAALYAKPSKLIPATKRTYSAQLAALKGHPIVVNKWASWCAPCRGEFPVLQSTSAKYGKQVAFIGLDSQDNDADATKFLSHFPVPYPSLVDRNSRIAQDLGIAKFFPTTIFYDARGKQQYVHDGPYTSDDGFAADIKRYALGQPQ